MLPIAAPLFPTLRWLRAAGLGLLDIPPATLLLGCSSALFRLPVALRPLLLGAVGAVLWLPAVARRCWSNCCLLLLLRLDRCVSLLLGYNCRAATVSMGTPITGSDCDTPSATNSP